ncbi:lytic polysaccharide monooxygenase [Streptomyces griseus]|uniref:lytic polysaccharide monooxygenase n=1 Tax=Streptomyces griseus TaxID=1911 RepID=UPI0036FEF708
MSAIITSPPSRQAYYLTEKEAALTAGKFIRETAAGKRDRDVPDDVVSTTPSRDGNIASTGQPHALALDEVKDPYGNDWNRYLVTSGEQVTVHPKFQAGVLVRRISVFSTTANWNPGAKLTRAQFDLAPDPAKLPYHRLFLAAPYTSEPAQMDFTQGGLRPDSQFAFTVKLPARKPGYHALLVEIDYANSGQAGYQILDLEYVG